jgi:hypothetical protein
MSTLMQRNTNDPNDPIYYAPRWLRDRSAESLAPATGEDNALRSPAPNSVAQDSRLSRLLDTAEEEALRATLQPDPVHLSYDDDEEEKRPLRRRLSVGGAIMAAAVGALAAAAALGVILFMPFPQNPAPGQYERTSLVVGDGSGNPNQMLPLGVRVTGPASGAAIEIGGLPAGATITTGKLARSGEWRIPLPDLAGAFVVPPIDFSGETRLSIVLRGSKGDTLASNAVRLYWSPPLAQAAPPPTATPVAMTSQPQLQAQPQPPPPLQAQPASAPPATRPPQAAEFVRQIDPKDVALLLKRAEALLVAGDIAPARALLQRAAEAHDPRAAHALASTYDPNELKKLGANGPIPNQELAQAWYQRAKEWGYREQEPRSETLAIFGR